MQRSPWRRRALAATFVAGSVALAFAAAGSNGIAVAPRILGIRHVAGTGSSGAVTLTNPGSATFTVGSIVYNCGTAPAMQLLGGSGGQSFTIPPAGSHPVVVECPSTLAVGMHRCTFSIHDGADAPILAFDGFCETRSSTNLQGLPSPVPFTNAIVGVESAPAAVVISNQSATPVPTLQLQVDNDNFLIGAPCQNQLGCDAGSINGSGSTQVNVICKPSAPGTHTGKLHAVGTNGNALMTPVDLSCTTGSGSGGPILTLTPPAVSLGDVEVKMGSSGTTIQMTNAGSGATSLTITSITISDNGVTGAGADWSFALDGACTMLPCALVGQQSLNAQLTFDPSGLDSRPARMTINYTDPGAKQASANLDGNGRGATLELVSANAIDFGVVPVGMNAMPQQFVLRNQGNRSTTATLAASPMAPFVFMTSVIVPPGQTPVSVGCFSSTEMLGTTTLNITSNDAATNPQTLQLSCDVRNTLVAADPPTIPLGEILKNSTVGPIAVTFDRVTPGAAIALGGATLAPDGPSVSIGALSQMMTPATVMVTITPTQDGVIAETISVQAGGQTINVPITGSVATASFTTTPVMTLGTFCVGQPTTPSSVTFTSTGTATISIADVALTKGAASPFDLDKTVPSVYPTSLAPLGGKATVLVTPKRADTPAPDGVTDMLTWTTSTGNPTSILTARYVADGGAIAPGELDYGDVPIRIAIDNDQQVTLQNCSTETLELLEPMIPAPFVLTDQFPTLLDPAGKATFSVAFQPTQVGPVERELVVTSTARDEFRVTLRGNGVSGSGSDGDGSNDKLDRTSFYACSGCTSNDPSGVLAIALAMCALVSRRRRRSTS